MGLDISKMAYNDYDWEPYPEGDRRVTGPLCSVRINRHNGYEMVHLLNQIYEKLGFTNPHAYWQLEKIIRLSLPSSVNTQIDVLFWIRNNWENHFVYRKGRFVNGKQQRGRVRYFIHDKRIKEI